MRGGVAEAAAPLVKRVKDITSADPGFGSFTPVGDKLVFRADVNDEEFVLRVVGRVESPLSDISAAPKQGDKGAPDAVVSFDPLFSDALRDHLEQYSTTRAGFRGVAAPLLKTFEMCTARRRRCVEVDSRLTSFYKPSFKAIERSRWSFE